MNKYNIKVGDYVELLNGDIGYVTDVNDDRFYVQLITNKGEGECLYGDERPYFRKYEETIPMNFRRIGENDFTKKENRFNPIKKLEICYATGNELAHKINELIDHINAIQERLNECDSTRTD